MRLGIAVFGLAVLQLVPVAHAAGGEGCDPLRVTARGRSENEAARSARDEMARRVRSDIRTRLKRTVVEESAVADGVARDTLSDRFESTHSIDARLRYGELLALSFEETGDGFVARGRLDRVQAAARHAHDAGPLEADVRAGLGRLEASLATPDTAWLTVCPGALEAQADELALHQQARAFMLCEPVPDGDLLVRVRAALARRAARLDALKWRVRSPRVGRSEVEAALVRRGLAPVSRGADAELRVTLGEPHTEVRDGLVWSRRDAQVSVQLARTRVVGPLEVTARQPGADPRDATRRATQALARSLGAPLDEALGRVLCLPPPATDSRAGAPDEVVVVVTGHPSAAGRARGHIWRAASSVDGLGLTDGPGERVLYARIERIEDGPVPGWSTRMGLHAARGGRGLGAVVDRCHGCRLAEHLGAYPALVEGLFGNHPPRRSPVIWGLEGQRFSLHGTAPAARRRVEHAVQAGGGEISPAAPTGLDVSTDCVDRGAAPDGSAFKATCRARIEVRAPPATPWGVEAQGKGWGRGAQDARERAQQVALDRALDRLSARLRRRGGSRRGRSR